MSEETSGSFTSRLFRKASANLAPAVTVQVADSPLSMRNSSSSPLAVERAPSFGNVVQSAVGSRPWRRSTAQRSGSSSCG